MVEKNQGIRRAFLKCLFSRKARKTVKSWLKCHRLIMTLVVRDEAAIIERNIRFHHAMGVDGFVVSSHNSADATNEILERLKAEGLVLKVFYRTEAEHRHSVWVDEMIRYAKSELDADWVINADADEFYYSDELDLKKSIRECGNANVCWVDSSMCFPRNNGDAIDNVYFIHRRLTNEESTYLGHGDNSQFDLATGFPICQKVIHRTRGYRRICDGNHSVDLWFPKVCRLAGVRLYHYYIANLEAYESKARRWKDSARLMSEGMGKHTKRLVRMFELGVLKKDFNENYNEIVFRRLMEQGVVVKDPSVLNFMRMKGLM